MPLWAWVVTCWMMAVLMNWSQVSMPLWAWVVTTWRSSQHSCRWFQCPYGLELLRFKPQLHIAVRVRFQCPYGLELLRLCAANFLFFFYVSMPLWAWVVTARMSNILNFSWYFLCIPAIYRCILAYLPIFFNQLSKFLRCESPSTFLGTCLSHHYFIIFLVTNTNTLLSGLYLISTRDPARSSARACHSVNALSGLYLISTGEVKIFPAWSGRVCQCPLGLIPHFYGTPSKT